MPRIILVGIWLRENAVQQGPVSGSGRLHSVALLQALEKEWSAAGA